MTDQEKIKDLEEWKICLGDRITLHNEMWIELGYKLGLNPKEGPVDIDGVMKYCFDLNKAYFHGYHPWDGESIVSQNITSPTLPLDYVLPKFVLLDTGKEQLSAFCLMPNKKEYYLHNGCWSIGCKLIDDVLVSSDAPYHNLNNLPLLRTSRRNWATLNNQDYNSTLPDID